MKRIYYFLVVAGLLFSANLFSQTEVTVIYLDGNQELFSVQDEGGLYFVDNQLLVASTSGNVKSIAMTDVQKLLLAESKGSVSLSEAKTIGNSLFVYPNPVEDYIYVLGIGEGDFNYVIYSVSGVVLQEGVCQQGVALDLSMLPAGFYMINVNGEIVRFSKL